MPHLIHAGMQDFFQGVGVRPDGQKTVWTTLLLFLFLNLFYSLRRGSNGFIKEKTILFQGSRGKAFKWALLFLFFLLFPTFLICSYFSLLFLENALLSLLFHFKMSCTRKNPEIFPARFRNQSYFSSGSSTLKHNKI